MSRDRAREVLKSIHFNDLKLI